jgi:hypothetical protein
VLNLLSLVVNRETKKKKHFWLIANKQNARGRRRSEGLLSEIRTNIREKVVFFCLSTFFELKASGRCSSV